MTSPSLEDRLQINDLFVRYACALDEGDVEGVVACFAPEGALESPAVGRMAGLAAIRQFAERFARFRAGGSQLRHVISNLRIDVAGDRARARCYLVAFVTRDGQSRLLPPGAYDCDLVRQGGNWVFQRRVVVHDHAYALEGL
jgi:3-phenylpropionate/cinnamic acid dioxygenase small subunit